VNDDESILEEASSDKTKIKQQEEGRRLQECS